MGRQGFASGLLLLHGSTGRLLHHASRLLHLLHLLHLLLLHHRPLLHGSEDRPAAGAETAGGAREVGGHSGPRHGRRPKLWVHHHLGLLVPHHGIHPLLIRKVAAELGVHRA